MKIDECKINFEFEEKEYFVNIYYMDSDNYCIRLYDNKENELFSVWIDSDGCFVTGNDEYYVKDIDNVVNEVYKIYNLFAKSDVLKKGSED